MAGVLAADIIGGFKPLHFARNPGFKRLGVKQRDIVDARLAGDKCLPGCGSVQTKWGENAHSGNHHPIMVINQTFVSPFSLLSPLNYGESSGQN